ncbi:MAG: hypothetical protein KGN01_04510 [Patescibacteria group bacterium]|nr:hypothetical protein [Patescibacteria group bacterium]
MSINLKIFLFFVVLPILLAYINASFVNYRNFNWGYNHVNEISIFLFTIASFVGAYITLSKKSSTGLRILSGLVFVFSLVSIYIIHSFLHFGF